MLYNPLAFALSKDALVNGGLGQLNKIKFMDKCQKIAPDGLGLLDILATGYQIVIAANDLCRT
jgi:hypothetical protein